MDEHNPPRDGISREKETLDIKMTKEESGIESGIPQIYKEKQLCYSSSIPLLVLE